MIEVHPVTGIDEVQPNDDLARLLMSGLAPLQPRERDIIVVTQKIVSKAEGRFVDLNSVTPSDRARELAAITHKDPRLVELVLSESTAVLRAAPHVLITRHRLGLVMANAGIDRSNVGSARPDVALLLPADPDASAQRLGVALSEAFHASLALVISDSFGRPWRNGVVNVAIGAWGLPALSDRRGQIDRDGRRLEVTQIALADLVASAAGLAMGEAGEGIPAAIVRGVDRVGPSAPASALVRPLEEDLFR